MDWYLKVLRQYTDFDGRARRKEYWMFTLVNFLIALGIGLIEGIMGSDGILGLFYLAGIIVPSIALGVRRLHDIDKSGWWLLISLIPLIGPIAIIVFACMQGTAGSNQYGPDPLADQPAIEA